MATATVHGIELYYEPLGRGPTCLVLHGWPGTDHAYLRPALDRLGEQLRLVYYDHRGHGRSDREAIDMLSLEQLADDADALAAHLGARQVVVVGHAHGASVALELALRHPERVAGLVLVAATPGDLGMGETLLDSMDNMPTPPEVEVLQRVPPATDDELEATMNALAMFFFHGEEADPESVFALSTFNAAAAARLMQASNWWSAFDRLGEIQPPVLLLVGRHDVFSPPAQSERIHKAVGRSEMVVFDRSGHLPWVEEPDRFHDCVRAWLQRLDGGAGAPG